MRILQIREDKVETVVALALEKSKKKRKRNKKKYIEKRDFWEVRCYIDSFLKRKTGTAKTKRKKESIRARK